MQGGLALTHRAIVEMLDGVGLPSDQGLWYCQERPAR
jgi:hypothetical protein